MKISRVFVLGFVLLLLLGITVSANAALVDNGDGTVTDTDTNLMWLQDANYAVTSGYVAGGTDWYTATTWADQLIFAGYDDWRLPSADSDCGFSYNCTNSEMGHIYYTELSNPAEGPRVNDGDFYNIQTAYYTSTGAGPNVIYGFYTDIGWQGQLGKTGDDGYAWAVRVVPEPISSTLFLIGGATLGFRQWRKRKTS